MAVEVENTSQVEELFRVLKRRLWWIIIPASIIALVGVSYAIVVPKKYVARAQVMVHDRPATMVRGSAPATAEGRVAPHKLKAPQRIRSVLGKLKWLEYEDLPTEVEAAEYRTWILKNISVTVPPMERNVQQQVVRISFSHTRADLAEQFLLELVRQWQHEVLQKNVRHLTDQRDQLIEQRADLLKNKKDLAATLLRLRRDNQIPPKTSGGMNRDQAYGGVPAFEEVKRLQRRLDADRTKLEEAEDLLEHMRAAEGRMPEMVPIQGGGAGDSGDDELAGLRRQLESRMAALAEGGYGPAHSAYKREQVKIAGLRSKIEQKMGVASSKDDHFEYSEPNAAKLEKQDDIAIKVGSIRRLAAGIVGTENTLAEAQKMANSLQAVYSQIGMKEADMALVEAGLESVSIDFLKVGNKLNSQEGPQGDPFEDLLKIRASKKPIEPNAWLISIFSVVLGLGVGLGLAVLLEFSKNCFRSINDIARSMEIPVLGAINRIETRRQRHVKRVQKLVVSLCLVMTIGVVGFTLWAWALHPDLLKASVVDSIDRLREVLG